MQVDFLNLLQSYLANFVEANIIPDSSNNEFPTPAYDGLAKQVADSDLGIGTQKSFALLDIVESSDWDMEMEFHDSVCIFYEACIKKL